MIRQRTRRSLKQKIARLASGLFQITDVVGTQSSAHRSRTSVLAPGTVARARLPDWALPVTPDAVYSKPQNADLGNRKLCHKASGWRQCGVQLHEQTGRSTNLSPVCFWETTSSVPQFSGDSCVCWSDNILPVQVASRFHPEVSHLDCHKKVQARGHPSFPGGGN